MNSKTLKREIRSKFEGVTLTAYRRTSLRGRGTANRRTLVLLTPGGHNIGDQAMYESCMARVDGPVTVIQPTPSGYQHVATGRNFPSRGDVVQLPALLTGSTADHLRAARELTEHMARADEFLVLGADIMDGAYSERISQRIWRLAETAARMGLQTRILGFSWNDSPAQGASEAAQSATSHGVLAFPRDAFSFDRFKMVATPTALAADIVFSNASYLDAGVRSKQEDREREAPYVILNISALVGKKQPTAMDQYPPIIEHLCSRGLHVKLLPHVGQAESNDIREMQKLSATFNLPDEVTMIDRLLSPTEVVDLAGRADAVVTGRMHLSILASLATTPSVVLSTQGKVAGLMDLLGSPNACIDPSSAFHEPVNEQLSTILDDPVASRERLQTGVATARKLAQTNFVWL